MFTIILHLTFTNCILVLHFILNIILMLITYKFTYRTTVGYRRN